MKPTSGDARCVRMLLNQVGSITLAIFDLSLPCHCYQTLSFLRSLRYLTFPFLFPFPNQGNADASFTDLDDNGCGEDINYIMLEFGSACDTFYGESPRILLGNTLLFAGTHSRYIPSFLMSPYLICVRHVLRCVAARVCDVIEVKSNYNCRVGCFYQHLRDRSPSFVVHFPRLDFMHSISH